VSGRKHVRTGRPRFGGRLVFGGRGPEVEAAYARDREIVNQFGRVVLAIFHVRELGDEIQHLLGDYVPCEPS